MSKQITGAVGIEGAVFRAGQEAELTAAAEAAGTDLTDARFAEALSGDWNPAKATQGGAGFTSDLAADFPGRAALVKLEMNAADVDALDRDGLIALKGIGETTADEILALRA